MRGQVSYGLAYPADGGVDMHAERSAITGAGRSVASARWAVLRATEAVMSCSTSLAASAFGLRAMPAIMPGNRCAAGLVQLPEQFAVSQHARPKTKFAVASKIRRHYLPNLA